jgi:UDP:flavonoid glycosyltransferase YjiC (YdhE family)
VSAPLRPKSILLATFGSLGDLHPPLAIAIELRRRGHRVTLASHPHYRARVEREGIAFADHPPDFATFGEHAAVVERVMHPTTGWIVILKEMLLPYLDASVAALEAAIDASGAEVLVAHPITLALPIVAEKRRLPWFGTALQPLTLFSALDPPPYPGIPHALTRGFGPGFHRAMFGLMRTMTRDWMRPLDRARVAAGLAPRRAGLEMAISPHGNLALFSRVLQPPMPDWPPHTVQTGFAFYDRPEDGPAMPPELERFLDAGEAPLVFALGSSAVYRAGAFYRESARAARALGRRAVLVIGDDTRNLPAEPLGDDAIAVPWASYSALFPRALAIVHQGGSGTTGQALRAGKPQLVVPFSHDQPDHGIRVMRAGVGLALAPERYRAARAQRLLARLVDEPSFAARASEAAAVVASEPGAEGAAVALETLTERAQVS